MAEIALVPYSSIPSFNCLVNGGIVGGALPAELFIRGKTLEFNLPSVVTVTFPGDPSSPISYQEIRATIEAAIPAVDAYFVDGNFALIENSPEFGVELLNTGTANTDLGFSANGALGTVVGVGDVLTVLTSGSLYVMYGEATSVQIPTSNLQIWWEADFADAEFGTEFDGMGTTDDPYEFAKLGNRGLLGGTFDATAPTQQAQRQFADGHVSAWFDGANDGHQYSGTAADTDFLAKESSVFVVFRPRKTSSGDDTLFTTNTGVGITGTGVYCRWEADGTIRYIVTQSGVVLATSTTSAGAAPAGDISILSVVREENDEDFIVRVNGSVEDTDSHTALTVASDTPLRIGVDEDDTQNWDGDLLAFIAYDRELSTDEVTAVEAYLLDKYGTGASPELATSLETLAFYHADSGTILRDDTYAQLVYDHSGYHHDLATDSEAGQPSVITEALNGHNVLRSGTQTLLSELTAGTAPQDAHPTTIGLVYKRRSQLNGALVVDLDVNNAKLFWVGGGATARMYAGTNFNHPSTPAIDSWDIWFLRFDGASSVFDRNGVRTTGDSGTREPTLSSRLTVFGPEDSSNVDDAEMATLVLWDGKMSDADQGVVQRHWNKKYALGYDAFFISPELQLTASGRWATDVTEGTSPDVASWNDTIGSFDLTEADAGERPHLVASSSKITGKQTLAFDGTDDLLADSPASTVLAVGNGALFVVFYADAVASSAANAYENELLVGDGANFGLYLKDDGGPTLIAYVSDGADKEVSLSCSVGEVHWAVMRWDGSDLYLSLDGGAESSVACGDVASLAGSFSVGTGTASFVGEVAEIATWDSGADADLVTALNSYAENVYGE